MHRIIRHLPSLFSIIFLAAITFSGNIPAQTIISILPVNIPAKDEQHLNAQQWQTVSLQLQDHFLRKLSGAGTISKLSREHILLLLKEMPSPDPDQLSVEAYKLICKKENLHYLLKCSVKSMQLSDKSLFTQANVSIVDGTSGKEFWGKVIRINKTISSSSLTEAILLNEVYKPMVNDLSGEIKSLKY